MMPNAMHPQSTGTVSQRAREAAIDQLSGIASPSAGVLRVEQAEALTLLIETARVSTNKDETIAMLREVVTFAGDIRWQELAEGAPFTVIDRQLLGEMHRLARSSCVVAALTSTKKEARG